MTQFRWIWLAAGLWLGAVPAWSQQAAPPIDHSPLERLRPLGVIPSPDAPKLLAMIADSVKLAGFEITSLDVREGQLEARRAEAAPSKNYDEIVLWLERDFQEPAKFVKLYFLYGRFEYLLAKRRDMYRIQVDEAFVQERVGRLKQSLLALATSNGE